MARETVEQAPTAIPPSVRAGCARRGGRREPGIVAGQRRRPAASSTDSMVIEALIRSDTSLAIAASASALLAPSVDNQQAAADCATAQQAGS